MGAHSQDEAEETGPVDEDTKLKKLDEWDKNLVSFARSICKEKEGELDARGHNKKPCAECVKLVRHVSECWFWLFLTKSKSVRERARKGKLELPIVSLDQVFFIAAGLLDPEVAVTLPEWGAA
jgi:hypothetical protein